MTLSSLDTGLLLAINHGMANALFDALMLFLSFRGYLLVLPFFLFLMYQSATKQGPERPSPLFLLSLALVCCSAVLVAGAVEHLLKSAVARVRPCTAIEGIRLITACPRSFSMPSGHALSSFAVAAPLYYLSGPYVTGHIRYYPLVLAFCIAFSRVYLGVHYPSDVVTGGLLGSAIGLLLALTLEWMRKTILSSRGRR